MIRSFCVLFFVSFVFVGAISSRAMADGQPRLIGSYGDWEAYVFFEDGEKVCYMATQPISKAGDYNKRGEAFMLITHRPADRTRDVFSYIAGYDYKSGGEAEVDIDGQKIALYTQDKTAWAPDAEIDGKLAESIRDGNKMVIKGTSSRGTDTIDTISLKGSSAAYNHISRECR